MFRFAGVAVAVAVGLTILVSNYGGNTAESWDCTVVPSQTKVVRTKTPTATVKTETPDDPTQTPYVIIVTATPTPTSPAGQPTPPPISPPNTGSGGDHDDDEPDGCIDAEGTVHGDDG
jgi:hypothetical protein